VLSKVDRKILVSFRLIQNFEIFDLVMAKVEKVNIKVTYNVNVRQPRQVGKLTEFYRFFTEIYTFITVGKEKLYRGKFTVVKLKQHGKSVKNCKNTMLIAMLCCAVLCCAVLCCAVLCCAVLCCAVLCCAVLCCAIQCKTISIKYYTLRYFILLPSDFTNM
jgi:hypothetical protein